MGAAAELAASKYLNVRWDETVDTFNVADIEPDWQVRWSSYPTAKVKLTDDPRWKVIAVSGGEHEVGMMRQFKVHGWIRIDRAQSRADKFTRDPGNRGRPAIFIPYRFLETP